MEEYYLGSDGEGNNYIVPVAQTEHFEWWSELDSEDERSWDEPSYANKLEGEKLIFSKYRLE